MVNIALLAKSNKHNQQLVPVGTKVVVKVILPLFKNMCPHKSLSLHMQLLLPLWEQQVATLLAQLASQWLKLMPAGSFAPRVPVESLAPVTIHVTKRQLLRLSRMSSSVLSTFVPRMQKENPPTSTLTSSPNMPVIQDQEF